MPLRMSVQCTFEMDATTALLQFIEGTLILKGWNTLGIERVFDGVPFANASEAFSCLMQGISLIPVASYRGASFFGRGSIAADRASRQRV